MIPPDNKLFSSAKILCIYILIFLFSTIYRARAQPSAVNDSATIIAGNFNPAKTIELLDLSSIHFSKFVDNRINFGLTGSEYHYILLKLNAEKSSGAEYLSIDNTSIDIVEIYRIFSKGKSMLLYRGGDLVAYENKIYNWHTAAVEVGKNPSFYLVALKAIQENINVRYEVLDKEALQLKYQDYDRVVLFYGGIVCMILAVLLVAVFLFKKMKFVAYLGYVICFSGWVLSHYGRIFPLLYPQLPVINKIIKPLSSLGACFFLILVLHLVFQQGLRSHRWIQRIVKSMLYGLFVLIGGMFLFLFPGLDVNLKYLLVALWHIGLVASILLVVFIPVFLFGTNLTARIFSTAMLAISITALVQLIATAGYISSFFINEHGMTVGSLLEMIIMAFGLFFGLLEEMKQKGKKVLALEQEQTETLKQLVTVQEHERKRIAADLHDNIGPLLAALKINFGRIVNTKDPALLNGVVVKTESIIDDSIAEIRNIAHNLIPKGLSSNGLINTLKEYLESIQHLYNKEITFYHQVESTLSIDLQTNLYRIICELVLNAARHSNARRIVVNITASCQMIFLSIVDNGQGFKHAGVGQETTLGLQSAESRVTYLKGKFQLLSEKDKGTSIKIEIPLQFNEAHVNSF